MSSFVLLWFDVEDYITPQSDDALLWLLRSLSEMGVPATLKFVGERVRALQNRGREDVLSLVRQCELFDVGYHTDMHSLHPTVAEYLEGLGWDDGVAEFERRERDGFDCIRETFGKPVICYGQPGASWAPQVYGALHRLGVPIYLDEGGHVGIDGTPFWYCGILTIYRMRRNCTRINWGEQNRLQAAIERFEQLRGMMADKDGVISIYFHECEFSTAEFWDGVNFANGINTPRENWRMPKLLDPDEAKRRMDEFRSYIAHIKGAEGCKFIRGSELLELIRDEAPGRQYSLDDLTDIAKAFSECVSFQRLGRVWLSAAECLFLLVRWLNAYCRGKFLREIELPLSAFFGPKRRYRGIIGQVRLSCEGILKACQRLEEHMLTDRFIPSDVEVNGVTLSPAQFAVACARCVLQLLSNHTKTIEVSETMLQSEKCVDDSPAVWRWIIFPPGFYGRNITELAKLQCWTIKPAEIHAG
ncbi:MAG: hypothetical protein RMK18_04275 [Armatimonadota bacterium]|nr:hypothetical protein [Armatimonadota bacterium]MCX7777397.1 hypothetical protein [Armatimonadota bacterium]MDW8025066.1 hypothetical protein [Armatimonadota bacterium]